MRSLLFAAGLPVLFSLYVDDKFELGNTVGVRVDAHIKADATRSLDLALPSNRYMILILTACVVPVPV